jgi:predicted helicase
MFYSPFIYIYQIIEKVENFESEFRKWIDDKYDKTYSPEIISGYIYGVLFSNKYREKYIEFLEYDFPRIPFVESQGEFEALSALGGELIEAHLMKKIPNLNMGDYKGKGQHNVKKPRYVEAKQQLYINDTQYFDNVPKDVWEFHIGGYQVIDKYLKYRKEGKINRPLNLDEIQNIENVVKILAFTIEQMKKIDAVFICP